MNKIFVILSVMTAVTWLASCAASPFEQAKISAAVKAANYTDDYIRFTLLSESGVNLGIGGDASPFSKGGIGGTACCAKLSGVGETIRVELKVGGFRDTAEQYKTYIRDVTIVGKMSNDQAQEPHSVLIVRFFKNHEVEAEIIPGDGSFGPDNLRIDRLFFTGPGSMRNKGQ